ncbi:MAG TPA: aminotransferase class I/II-fold pyridoxal phosphate-dependent enzyme [Acidimicrobiales bacterium]|jgi:aspartate aminotransferase
MFDDEVISFAHGNGLRAPDSAVIAAGIRALLDQRGFPLERYNFLEHYEPLEDAIHTTMWREGFPLDHLDSICIDAGTTKLFVSFLSNVTQPGDVILTAPAFYHGLVGWCRLLKLGLQIAPTPDQTYKLTYDSLESAWQQCQARGAGSPKVVVVFNPTPTGAIYHTFEMQQIAEFCIQHDVMAIEDNVFARTRYDPYSTIAHLANDERMRDRVVSVDGCSKADGLANLRIGWAVGPPHLIQAMESIKASTTVALPHVTLVMAEAALTMEWSARQRDAATCRARAAEVTRSIDEINDCLDLSDGRGLQVVHQPQAGHSLMVDASTLGVAGERLAPLQNSLQLTEDWLDRAAVAVSPLYSCGFDGHEFRLNFASVNHTPRWGGGRWEHPSAGDPRPRLVRAVARDDQDSIRELFRLAEKDFAANPVDDTAPGLIHEGLVERIASALQPRSVVRSFHTVPLHTNTVAARQICEVPSRLPSAVA